MFDGQADVAIVNGGNDREVGTCDCEGGGRRRGVAGLVVGDRKIVGGGGAERHVRPGGLARLRETPRRLARFPETQVCQRNGKLGDCTVFLSRQRASREGGGG